MPEGRFDSAGVYTFFCQAHPGMRGTIRVGDPAAPLPAPTPGATAPPAPAQTQTTLEGAVTLGRSQKGARVRGSVDVKVAGSRLQVSVSARLNGGRRAKPVRIGQLTRTSTPAGKVSFAVGVAAKARKALRRLGRLPVTVDIALTPPGGRKLTRSATSTLRGR